MNVNIIVMDYRLSPARTRVIDCHSFMNGEGSVLTWL